MDGPSAAAEAGPAPGPTAANPSGTGAVTPLLIAIAAIAVAAAVGAAFWLYPRPAATVANSQPPSKPAGISVAVLPFLNLSSDKDQEFFSDGITEEVTLALVGVKGLKVVARSSAFVFKNKNEDVRMVGRALSATDVIEGSVRKQGNKLRISAELIRTDTGEQLWSQSYDRELKDVFAVQEDIARAIASALQAPLGLNAGENLVANRTNDTGAYENYLRALALYRASDIGQAIALLESIVKRNPTYAPAWSLLSLSHINSPPYVKPTGEISYKTAYTELSFALDKADNAAREAVRLDPNDALGYAALGQIAMYREQWAAADMALAKALALDPTNPYVLGRYQYLLWEEGRLKQAVKIGEELIRLEPELNAKFRTATLVALKGDYQGAIRLLEQMPPEANRNINLATFYAGVGQYERAAQTLLALPPGGAVWTAAANRVAADIIRTSPRRGTFTEQMSPADNVAYAWVYVFVGMPERYLKDLEQVTKAVPSYTLIWARLPAFTSMRKTDPFKEFVRKIGLVDYWRATSWPDICHPVGARDFACN
jgi:TolB-like protein